MYEQGRNEERFDDIMNDMEVLIYRINTQVSRTPEVVRHHDMLKDFATELMKLSHIFQYNHENNQLREQVKYYDKN
jgi:hypothetical protein